MSISLMGVVYVAYVEDILTEDECLFGELVLSMLFVMSCIGLIYKEVMPCLNRIENRRIIEPVIVFLIFVLLLSAIFIAIGCSKCDAVFIIICLCIGLFFLFVFAVNKIRKRIRSEAEISYVLVQPENKKITGDQPAQIKEGKQEEQIEMEETAAKFVIEEETETEKRD